MRIFLVLTLFAATDGFPDGVRAYREGRYREALEAFSAAEQAAGDEVPAELLYNKALAALRVGELTLAETAALEAAERGGSEFPARRDFLLGNVAFQRAELAERQASGPEAEPFALDVASSYAEQAKRAWVRAAITREDWPAARRNVERALLKLEALRARKAEREAAGPDTEQEPESVPVPAPDVELVDPAAERPTLEEVAPVEARSSALTPEQVRGLLEVLELKEREKRKTRRASQEARRSGSGRDW